MTHLGVRRESVYRRIDARGLPAHRVGRLVRLKLSEVDDWVRAGRGDETGERKDEDAESKG